MKVKRYWFPVRPARNGWGWGLPVAWQGWAVYVVFLALLIGGQVVLASYTMLASIAYSFAVSALFLLVVFITGEPQRMRDNDSP